VVDHRGKSRVFVCREGRDSGQTIQERLQIVLPFCRFARSNTCQIADRSQLGSIAPNPHRTDDNCRRPPTAVARVRRSLHSRLS
jgi:hypothetical protein